MVSKSDLDFHIKHKADVNEVQLLIHTLVTKFEDDFSLIND